MRSASASASSLLAAALQAYTGHYENARYRLYLTLDRDLKPAVRLFRGAAGEDLVLMEKTASFVPADKADGEDRVAVAAQFTGSHRKWADVCRELQIDFGRQLEPSMAFNSGCSFFPKPPETIALKQRSFAYSDPVR